ncbi:MAG: hypothetical protein K9G30_06130 [Parvibaculum sp.]|nr:hypothetical protein [Parvibaculum sp.]
MSAVQKKELESRRRSLVEALSKLKSEERKDYLEKLEKQAETYLQEQLKAALAITQRAVTLSAILGAVVASIAGLAGTLAARMIDLGVHYAALVPLLICLLVALARTTKATMPGKFFYAGSNPIHWTDDIAEGRLLDDARIDQLSLYSESISDNVASLRDAQTDLASGFRWVGIGLTIFVGAEFVITLSLLGKHGLPSLP